MSRGRDLEALGFARTDDPSAAELKERWHEIALDHHPDRGGPTDGFAELTGCYSRLRAALATARRCEPCQGVGHTSKVYQTGVIKLQCRPCKGTGKVTRR